MITEKRKRGNMGEKKALQFLKTRGFKIIEKNYNNKFGEIDLICKRGGSIHFIEVKSSFTYYDPEENMTQRKMEKITKAANLYMLEKNIDQVSIFFDLICVNFKKRFVRLYPNINTDLQY
jgi:putative endonuclease